MHHAMHRFPPKVHAESATDRSDITVPECGRCMTAPPRLWTRLVCAPAAMFVRCFPSGVQHSFFMPQFADATPPPLAPYCCVSHSTSRDACKPLRQCGGEQQPVGLYDCKAPCVWRTRLWLDTKLVWLPGVSMAGLQVITEAPGRRTVQRRA